jgi:hypothetical protein
LVTTSSSGRSTWRWWPSDADKRPARCGRHAERPTPYSACGRHPTARAGSHRRKFAAEDPLTWERRAGAFEQASRTWGSVRPVRSVQPTPGSIQ